MKQKIYIPQPIAAAGEDYLIEKGYEIVRGSGKTDKESIKNDIAVCDAMRKEPENHSQTWGRI